jgi:hypothetical protein
MRHPRNNHPGAWSATPPESGGALSADGTKVVEANTGAAASNIAELQLRDTMAAFVRMGAQDLTVLRFWEVVTSEG